MAPELYLVSALIIIALTIITVLINKKLAEIKEIAKPDETLVEWLKSSQEAMQASSKTLNERLDRAAQIIAGVQRNMGEIAEIGRGMKDLQEFLRSPKLRGNIGEEVLKDLLAQMFPKEAFYLQHTFKSGEKVDVALKTEAGILPIDSKFPMENFQKMIKTENKQEREKIKKVFIADIKRHIKDIARKYILPEEGTMDFALMYLPSEAVYYEVVNLPELLDFARQYRVYPVSPTTLYAHLQMILLSFEGKKIEAKSRQVFRMLRALKQDYKKTETILGVLGRHINNAYTQMNNVFRQFSLLGQKLDSARALGEGHSSEEQLKLKA